MNMEGIPLMPLSMKKFSIEMYNLGFKSQNEELSCLRNFFIYDFEKGLSYIRDTIPQEFTTIFCVN